MIFLFGSLFILGFMGFGRIGCDFFCVFYWCSDFNVCVIVDVVDVEVFEYFLCFDLCFGRFFDEVFFWFGNFYVCGQQIFFVLEFGIFNWVDFGVDVVIEVILWQFLRVQIEEYFECGVQKVIFCVLLEELFDIMVVIGVNDYFLSLEYNIIFNGLCMVYCVVLIFKIFDVVFGVECVFLNLVYVYMNKQCFVDVLVEDLRFGCVVVENIILQDMNLVEVIVDILLQFEGWFIGFVMNVLIYNGLVVDLICWYSKDVIEEVINEVVCMVVVVDYWLLIDYEDDLIVFFDIEGSLYLSIFDLMVMMMFGIRVLKMLSWFDNGWGYV